MTRALPSDAIGTMATRSLDGSLQDRTPSTAHVTSTPSASEPGTPNGKEHLAYWIERLKLPQVVYVVGFGLEDPVKIGTTRDFHERFKTLQTSLPQHLALFHVVPGGSNIENRLHRLFDDMRVRSNGEWFGRSLEELVQIHLWVSGLADACVDVHDGGDEAPEIGHRWTPFMRSALQKPSATDRFDPVPAPLLPVGRRG